MKVIYRLLHKEGMLLVVVVVRVVIIYFLFIKGRIWLWLVVDGGGRYCKYNKLCFLPCLSWSSKLKLCSIDELFSIEPLP